MGFIESRCTAAYKTSCQEALVVWFPLTASLHHGRPVLQKKVFENPWATMNQKCSLISKRNVNRMEIFVPITDFYRVMQLLGFEKRCTILSQYCERCESSESSRVRSDPLLNELQRIR